MRKSIAVLSLLAVYGCQQNVVVPTAKELIDNPILLREWQAKCDSGEYSHLEAGQKARMCATTGNATISVAQTKSGGSEVDFFNQISKRRK